MAAAATPGFIVRRSYEYGAVMDFDFACHATRLDGGSRILALGVYNTAWFPHVVTDLHAAGWDVGILQAGSPTNKTVCSRSGCAAWGVGDPPLIRYAKFAASHGWRDLQDALVSAVAEWRPAFVLPDYRVSAQLVESAARQLLKLKARTPEQELVLRSLGCSLPRATEKWAAYNSKIAMVKLAGDLGARIARHTPLSSSQARALDSGSRERLARLLPLVAKTNFDGSGKGVQIVRTRAELDGLLRALTNGSQPAMLEQWVDGYQVEYAGAVVDGEVVAGFGLAVIVAESEVGPPVLLRTVNLPEAARFFAAFVKRLGFTGLAEVDMRVDRAGRTYFLDPNMRPAPYVGVPAAALGLRVGLMDALLAQIRRGAPVPFERAHAPEPLSRAINILRVRREPEGALALAYCPDVWLHLPWPFVLREARAGAAAGFDARECAVRFRGDPPNVALRHRCPASLCPGSCAAPLLPAQPRPLPADGASSLVHEWCEGSLAWAAEHLACAGPVARAAHVAARYHDHGVPLKLCGRPAGSRVDSPRWNLSEAGV